MRVLVTGGAGFIGSHIVDQLIQQGHDVAVIDDLSSGSRDNLAESATFFQTDIRDKNGVQAAFDAFRPEAVCHQAAQLSVSRSVREPEFDAEINVIGLLNVFSEAVRAGVKRIVFASSGGVLYGEVESPAPENHPAAPISPYGVTKLAGEGYLGYFAREHGIEGVALRYSNVYGPRQSPHGEAGVVAIFTERMLEGKDITVNGDGKYIRDYVFGEDVARANVAALTQPVSAPFQAYNIGTGKPTDVNEIAEKLQSLVQQRLKDSGKAIDVPEPKHGPARPGDLRSNLVDATAAGENLSWKPTVTLNEGLQKTVDWFHGKA